MVMARKNNIKSLAKSDNLDYQTTTASNLNQLSHSKSHLKSEANLASHLIANNDDSDSDFDAHESDTDSDIDENHSTVNDSKFVQVPTHSNLYGNVNDYNSESNNGTKKNNMCLPFGIAIGVLLIVVLLIIGYSNFMGPKEENNPNITKPTTKTHNKTKQEIDDHDPKHLKNKPDEKFDRKNPESDGDKKTDNKKTNGESDDKKVEPESNPEKVIGNSEKTESPASESEDKKTNEDDKKVEAESENKKADEDDKKVEAESENKKADEDDKKVEAESENKKADEDDKKVEAESINPDTVIENSEKTDSPGSDEAETTGATTNANTEHSEGSDESVDNKSPDTNVVDLSTQNGETVVNVSQNATVTDSKDKKQKKQKKNRSNLSESSESKKSDANGNHETIDIASDSETTKSDKKSKLSSRFLNVVLFVYFLGCAIVLGLLGSGCFGRQTLINREGTVTYVDDNRTAAITTLLVQPLAWVLFVIFLIAAVYQLGYLINSFVPGPGPTSNNSVISKTGKNRFVMDNTFKMSNGLDANRETDDLRNDSLLRMQKKYDSDNDIDHKLDSESDPNLVSGSKATEENLLDSESQVMETNANIKKAEKNLKKSKKIKQSTFSVVRFVAAVGLIVIGILFITGIGVVADLIYTPGVYQLPGNGAFSAAEVKMTSPKGITHRNFSDFAISPSGESSYGCYRTFYDVFSIVLGIVLIIAGTVYLLWSFYGILKVVD